MFTLLWSNQEILHGFTLMQPSLCSCQAILLFVPGPQGLPTLTLEFYVYVLQLFFQSACQNLSFNSLSIRVCLLSVTKTVKNFLALPICQLHAIQLLYQYSTDSAVQLLLLVGISKEGCNTTHHLLDKNFTKSSYLCIAKTFNKSRYMYVGKLGKNFSFGRNFQLYST